MIMLGDFWHVNETWSIRIQSGMTTMCCAHLRPVAFREVGGGGIFFTCFVFMSLWAYFGSLHTNWLFAVISQDLATSLETCQSCGLQKSLLTFSGLFTFSLGSWNNKSHDFTDPHRHAWGAETRGRHVGTAYLISMQIVYQQQIQYANVFIHVMHLNSVTSSSRLYINMLYKQ